MKKAGLLIVLVLLVMSFASVANPVDLSTAQSIGAKFLNANTKIQLRGANDLQLVKTYSIERGDAAFYIFNAPSGFVIVAADDCATPILGYSDEGKPFDPDNVPVQLEEYLQSFVEQIQYGVENNVKDETTAQQWEQVRTTGRLTDNRDGDVVGPLITTQWGQTGVYGSMCPNGVVGCVGVAVAQVMNYWQYPPKGVGHIAYSGHEAFFSETTYHWDSLYIIPDALPTLMYHAAKGACSIFNANGSTGSSLPSAQWGMVEFFDYDTLSYYAEKDNYFNYQWINLIKDNLDDGIPVMYRGNTSGGVGHAWVCDGYDQNEMFHMNWGWEGLDDGWFLLTALSAGGYTITGGGNGPSFGAVFDMVPLHSPLKAKFEYEKEGRLVHFYDFSKNISDSYWWNFGDGTTSDLQNPTHEYDTVGAYTVILTVSKDGVTSTCSQMLHVKNSMLWSVEIPNNLGKVGFARTLDFNMDGLHDLFCTDGSVTNIRYFSVLKNCDSISPDGFSFRKENEFPGYFNTMNVASGLDKLKNRVVDLTNKNESSIIGYGADGNDVHWYYFGNSHGTLDKDLSFDPPFFDEKMEGDSYLVNFDTVVHKGFKTFDYNNDGLTDVIVGPTVYKNIGNRLFHPITDVFPLGTNTIIDIDKDGDLDAFSQKGLYINDGNGSFRHVSFPVGIADDFDGDGQIDVMTDLNGGIKVLTGSIQIIGDSLYMVADTIINTFEGDLMDAVLYYDTHADINNDGIVEIIASEFAGSSLAFNLVDGRIDELEFNPSIEGRTPTWIDYNHDGSIDLIRGDEFMGDGPAQIYKNINSNNLPPTAPTNLTVETSGNTAFLHWNAATDDHTYSGSLTYNIAVGSAPESCDIYSPMSNLETGKHYAISKGNAGMGTVWRINDLPNGTYYWRVQAIDQAFAAGPFSEMETFTIFGNNLPPAMQRIVVDSYLNKRNTLSEEDFQSNYSDRDNDTLLLVTVTQLPKRGTLFLNDEAVAVGQNIPSYDLGKLYYVTTNLGEDCFKIKPFDGTDYSEYETDIILKTRIFEPVWKLEGVSGDVAWGDYNNDGLMDFAATWGIYKNVGGSFVQITDNVPSAEHVYWADVNNDGKLDAVYSETVLINTGNDNFVWQAALQNHKDELSALADVNNDNMVDYLITGEESRGVLYQNSGNGFSEDNATEIIPSYRGGQLKFADFDNDGWQDFTITGWMDFTEKMTEIYRNNRNGFEKLAVDLPHWGTGSLDWGDYDKDGDLDLLLSGYDGSGIMTAIFNNDRGNFRMVTNETIPGVIQGQSRWMDYNNDGLLDILLVGYDGKPVLYLFRNTGHLSFYQIPIDQIGIDPLWFSNVSIADFDGDGYQDVILSGQDKDWGEHTYIFRNTMGTATSAVNIAPSVPSNLQSEVVGNRVHLTWNKSSDNTTSPKALAYNVYIRSEETGEFVVSPLSDMQTGFRKVVDRGNCVSNRFMDINSLDEGTYYWSVQAIDNGMMPSAFATEQSFTVTCSLSVTEIYDTVQCVYYWNGQYFFDQCNAIKRFTTPEGCDSTAIIHVQVLQDTCWNPIYVTEQGAGLHNGNSWENAMSDLQKAIDLAAMHGSDIWVKQGTYTGDLLQESAFNVYGGVSLYGGFLGNEPATFDISLRDPMSHPTILDGQNQQRVLNSTDEGVYALHCIDGFILQNGKSDWYPGALLGDYSILSNSTVRNNECVQPQSMVRHGAILGGIVVNSIITRNTMFWIGVSRSIVLNCVIANNTGDYLCNPTDGCLVRNSIIVDNVCPMWGSDSWGTLNCAIASDFVPEGNMMISTDNDGSDPNVNYVRFEDPDNDNYRLLPNSACIDAGNMNETELYEMYLPSVDIKGWPRVLNGAIDMGAYEYYDVPTEVIYDTICEGQSYVFHNLSYDSTGVFSQHIHQNPTLDTLCVLYLQVNPSYNIELPIPMQEGGVTWNGQTLTEPGVYPFDFTTAKGCDSIVNVILYDDMVELCESDLPYPYGDTVFGENTPKGLYSVNANGQLQSLYLSIEPVYHFYDTIEVCGQWHDNEAVGFVYDPLSDDYVKALQTRSGCDSVFHLHVIEHPTYHLHFLDTINSGEGYFANGFYAPAKETYNRQYWTQTLYFETATGCDSIRTLQLTILGAPIRYVTPDGTGDGTSWENATSDLQAAIDEMEKVKGNVWVAQGTYYGDGISESAFYLKNNVNVYGGFVGDEPEDYDLTLRDLEAHPSILDGQYTQRTVKKVFSMQDNRKYAVLDGFVIQHGNNNVHGWMEAILRNCIIRDGIGCGVEYSTLENCLVINNNNDGDWAGGANVCTAKNCTFVKNTAYVTVVSSSTLVNCIMWNNGSYYPSANTILYSASDDQMIDGEGNILISHDNDGYSPGLNYVRFEDPEHGDFRLSCASDLINKGIPDGSIFGLPQKDWQGNSRVMDDRVDMGAFEFDPLFYMDHVISVTTNTGDGGTITGGGVFSCGQICTLVAIPNEGYSFANWTEDGEVVSSDATYHFAVSDDRTLTANFVEGSYCYVVFDLHAIWWMDGWYGGYLVVDYGDGNSEQFTLESGTSASFDRLVATGSHISLSWISGGWDSDCSFDISFENGVLIYQGSGSYYFHYDFTLDCAEAFVPHTISAVADPEEGGVVNGTGIYEAGDVVTLTAIPNDNYTFVCWTENGVQVSTEANYSFNAVSDRNLVAHFSLPISVVTTANLTEGGTITGAGMYNNGSTCTLTAIPNEGYLFLNWSRNGEVVDCHSTYSFIVIENVELEAVFMLLDGILVGEGETSTTIPSNSRFLYTLSQQIYTPYELGGVENITSISFFNCGGTATRNYDIYMTHTDQMIMGYWNDNGDWVSNWIEIEESDLLFSGSVTMTCGYWSTITLDTPFVYDGTSNLAIMVYDHSGGWSYPVMDFRTFQGNDIQTFSVESWETLDPLNPPHEGISLLLEKNQLILNYKPSFITQTIPLVPGWNWYSSFIELNGIDGLAMLEESLGDNCSQISSQTAFTKYYPQGWYGSLTTMVNEQMYRLKMTNPATVNMFGSIADPAQHPITLAPGWSHIGYISASAMSVEEALSGLDATVGDLIKTQTAYTKFYGAENGWFGSLSTIQPGDGLMYKSGNTESVTLIYPQASRGETKANLTAENNHWVPDMREYPTNMTIMAVVEIDNQEVTSDEYELAVFTNNECRGSVKLLYVEPIDRHVAFMTITGEDEDNLSFALYDKITGIENFNTENRVVFHTDDMLGDFDNPYVVRFGNVESGDVKIYPNPVKAGETINVIVPEKAVLEIVNTLGEVVGTQTLSEGDNIVKTPATPDVYMLRIISNGNDVKCQRIVLK